MKIKLKRASARVHLFLPYVCLFLAAFCTTVSSVDFPTQLKNSEVQGNQNGRDGSHRGIDEPLDVTTPKASILNVSNLTTNNRDFEDNEAVGMENCTLVDELHQQMKSAGKSEWAIDGKTLELLENDPQKLIHCTQPGDKVIFKLRGVQKFKRTMVVFHELEFISDCFERNKTEVEHRAGVSFTCPDSGPFLIVKATNFTANGFIVENCEESSGDSTIVINTGSSAVFEDVEISNNNIRAFYVESHSVVVLKNSYFNNDGTRHLNGGVIHLASNVSLSISNSSFFGNEASEGGVLFANASNAVAITGSSFSENNAGLGGAIHLHYGNTLKVESSTMSQNNADEYGGAIILGRYNTLKVENSTMSQNNASRSGGAIYLHSNNTLKANTSTMSQNNASRSGGAIYLHSNNTLKANTSIMSQNNALWSGGAIFLYSNNILKVERSTMSQNNADEYGGAIILGRYNTLKVENSTMSQNNAEDGGAIYLHCDNTLKVESSTMSGNNASRAGGAMNLNKKNNLTLVNSRLMGNEASESGGAINFGDYNNNATILNSVFIRNKAELTGGAVKLASNCQINMTNSSMTCNDAKWGGGVYLGGSVVAIVSSTHISSNTASRGGAIYVDTDCDISIYASNFTKNHADFGGCFYGKSSSTKVYTSSFLNNSASQSGGCFFIKSYTINFEANRFYLNQAQKDGGAIHAFSNTLLRMKEDHVVSNSALNGGGIALISDSRILCESCTFRNNTANGGGGVYIESEMTQIVIAQFAKSKFLNNSASQYGGGMAIKTFGSRRFDCARAIEPCSRVLLIETTFVGNIAKHSGSATLVTMPKNMVVACASPHHLDRTKFLTVSDIWWIQRPYWRTMISNSSSPCSSWKHNRLASGAYEQVIGTFGQTINVTSNSTDGSKITGDSKLGFTLQSIKSGVALPTIKITTIDAFGNALAPTLHEEDAIMLKAKGFLQQAFTFSFVNGTCTTAGIVGFVQPGNYTMRVVPRSDDMLEATKLTLVVRNCQINEEPTRNGTFCEKCGETSYNFNSSGGGNCASCPKGANCTGTYIVPTEGYWHKSPCHDKMKKCIVEKSCKYTNRTRTISHFVQNYTECGFNKTNLEEYEKIQCHKGYKGPLCGSCKKSYGLSSNYECSKCGHTIIVVLRFIGAIVYLLVGTIITIKGVLPSNAPQQGHEDAETPLLEPTNTTSLDVGGSSQVKEEIENGSNDSSQPLSEVSENPIAISTNQTDDIEVTKLKLISLNYFQVTSTAAGMDVEWTKKILDMLQGLNLLGAATTDSISYSFDCLFTSASNDGKAIWRLLFSLFVPLIVISLLSLHWGYRSMTKHGGDGFYFLRRLLLTVVTVTYATYFDLTRVAMRTFSCIMVYANVDPFSNIVTKYWIGDTSIECYKNTHIVLISISLVIAMLVTICFPLFCSLTLNQHKSEVKEATSWTYETFGFLGGPFKQRFIYWECVTMIKKAILSIIIVFSYSLEVQAQGLLILLVLVFFLFLHYTCYPYDEAYHSLNYYESGSLLVSCMTYTLVQFFSIERCSEVVRSIVSLSIITINVGFACLMAYKIIKDLTQLLKALLRSQNIHVPNNMNVISLVRVYSIKRRFR